MNSFNRHTNILDYAISSLLRRKRKNIALLSVYTIIVSILASTIFFVHSIKQEAATALKEAPDIVVQRTMAGRHNLIPPGYADKIAAIRGVERVSPRLWGYYYDPVFGANYTVITTEAHPIKPGEILIGEGVARNQRVISGDMLTFKAASGQPLLLTVSGTLPAEAELVASDTVIMSAGDFTGMFGFPSGFATDLAVTVPNRSEIATVAARIFAELPDTRPILKSEILRTYESIFDWRGGMMLVILSSALISFVIFAWDKAAGLSAEERREIGTLKSVGWDTSDILILKFWEGIVISLTAFLFGLLIGYLHVYLLNAPLFAQALKGWSILYPDFRLHPSIDFYQLSILFTFSVIPYTAATIIPSWLAATTDPDDAMRR